MELSKKLVAARIENDMTQMDVAKKLDKSQSYVSKVESGQSSVDIVELKQFAKLYKKDFSYFI